MSNRGFVIRDDGFGLEHLNWKSGPGDCNFREELRDSCPKKYNSGRQKDCVSAVTAHCCKHVLHGTDVEKEAFQDKTGQDELPDRFHIYPEHNWNYWSTPRDVREAQNLERKTIENYKDLSHSVAQTAKLVAVTAHNNQIRFVCSGEGVKASEFTDYIQYTAEKTESINSETDNGRVHAKYEIVSMFLQNIRLTEFSMMDLLYRKYCEGENRIDRVMICPSVEDSEDWGGSIQDRINFVKDYVELQNILRNAGLFAEKAGCRRPVAFGMYWHYIYQLANQNRDDRKLSDAITSVLSSENPIALLFDSSSQNPLIQELKKTARYNEAFLRNTICHHYLVWICNVNDNKLLCDYDYRFGNYWKANIDDYRILAWRMFLTSFMLKRCMGRLDSILSKKTEMRNLMTEDAPYSLADFSAFQLWSDMFTAHACIELLKKYRRKYKDLYGQDNNASYSPWSRDEDTKLNNAKKKCRETIRDIISAFPIPAMERWCQRFLAVFQWNAAE